MSHRPVTVVTGFLGSGKTTLIGRLLDRPALRHDTAVIVNELGEAALDHELLRRVDERAVALAGGCLCCGRREDLAETLRELLDADERGERPVARVVIETSGLADPAPIMATIAGDPVLSHHFRVDRVIAAVAAVDGDEVLERHPEALAQVAAADRVALTKGDLTAPADVARLRARLAALNPSATVVEVVRGAVAVEALLGGSDRPRPFQTMADAAPAHRPGAVRAISLVLDEPLDWTVFGVWLSLVVHAHGDRLLRFKALVDTGGDGPVALNGVRHVVHPPEHHAGWPDGDRRSRLVFVVDGLDPADLLRSLRAFQRGLGPGAEPAAGAVADDGVARSRPPR